MSSSAPDSNDPGRLPGRDHDLAALPPGTRLGEMEILRVLAVGGFGIVYLARDHSLDRDVAVKEFMPAQLAGRSQGQRVTVRSISDAETYAMGLQSFVNEAKLLAQFSHPAMVKVYRFWEANGTGYMVMPYLRGPTLREVRRSLSQPPTEAWLRSVIDPLLDALAMLHAEGVYHRDIAPDNVLVSGAGIPVLLDFGAARRLIGDRTQSLTAILKPSYAPIEQYAEAKQLRQGPWTDLYALGALVTYLLDGKPPPASTARAIHDDMELLVKRRIPGVSQAFLAAIDWALAVRPQDRPQNVAELRDALNGWLVPPPPIRPAGASALAAAGMAPALGQPRFPTTQRLDTPIAPRLPASAAARKPGGPAKAPVFRLWRVATASVLLLSVAAWTPSLRPPAEAATATASPPVSAPQPPAVALDTNLAAPAAIAPSVEESSAVPALPVAVLTRAPPPAAEPAAPAAPPPRAAKRSVRKNPATPKLQVVKLSPEQAGPRELCSSRNVFTRPYCVQRRCDEARFKSHVQCVSLRREVQERYRRD
jgi:serine/threonine protein kinase